MVGWSFLVDVAVAEPAVEIPCKHLYKLCFEMLVPLKQSALHMESFKWFDQEHPLSVLRLPRPLLSKAMQKS